MQGRMTRDDVIAIVKSHVALLTRHSIYVSKIIRDELSLAEIADYISVLLYRFPVDINFKNKYGFVLQEAVTKRLVTFKKFLKILSDKNESLALCAFYLALKCELTYAACDARVLKSKSLPFSEKIYAALNCADSLKLLLSQVKSILPLEFELLSECVHIKEISGKQTRNSTAHGLVVAATFSYKWSHLNNIISDANGVNVQCHAASPIDKAIKCMGWYEFLASVLEENKLQFPTEEQSQISRQGHEKQVMAVHERTLRNSELSRVESDDPYNISKYDVLYENIQFFFDILPVHLEVYEIASHGTFMIEVTEELARSVLVFKHEYEMLQKKINKQRKSIQPRAENIQQRLKNVIAGNNIQAESEELGWLYPVLDDVNIILAHLKKYDENMKDNFEAMIDYDWFQNNKMMFDAFVVKSINFLTVLERDIAQLEKVARGFCEAINEPQPRAVVTNTVDYRLGNEVSSESFVAAQQAKTRDWKETVAKKRESKKCVNRYLKPAAEIESVTPTPHLAVHHHWREILMNLKEKHFEVLKCILTLKCEVTYSDVYFLITNHLSGVIEEYGSSHKRIRILAYCAEITGEELTHKKSVDSEVVTVSKATGGLWKPHKTSSHYLQHFNLASVAGVLISAGINTNLLQEVMNLRKQQGELVVSTAYSK